MDTNTKKEVDAILKTGSFILISGRTDNNGMTDIILNKVGLKTVFYASQALMRKVEETVEPIIKDIIKKSMAAKAPTKKPAPKMPMKKGGKK